jgi:hypothetical protein
MTVSQMTAASCYAAIVSSVEKIKNDNDQRFPEAASFGDYIRQGDVHVELIEKVPENSSLQTEPSNQVAPGNTKGSRHILSSLDGVEIYILNSSTELQGPIVKTIKETTLTHPEHGDWILPANRVYAITYQRAYGKELKRAMD